MQAGRSLLRGCSQAGPSRCTREIMIALSAETILRLAALPFVCPPTSPRGLFLFLSRCWYFLSVQGQNITKRIHKLYSQTAMPKKNLIPLLILFIALFTLYGDTLKFLPKPVRDTSVASRKFFVGLWPKWLRPRDTNEQRERQIEKLEKSPSPSR